MPILKLIAVVVGILGRGGKFTPPPPPPPCTIGLTLSYRREVFFKKKKINKFCCVAWLRKGIANVKGDFETNFFL